MKGDLDIFVVQRGLPKLTIECLTSLVKQGITEDITLVDNASGDGSLELVLEELEELTVIENKEHKSWSSICNEMASKSQKLWVSFLNNDLAFKAPFFPRALELCKALPAIRMASPRLWNNTLQCWEDAGEVDKHGNIIVASYQEKGDVAVFKSKPFYVCPILIHRQTFLDLGGFDPKFYFGMEEVDYAFRLYEKGYHTATLINQTAFHYGGATRVKYINDDQAELNRWYFRKKWGSRL